MFSKKIFLNFFSALLMLVLLLTGILPVNAEALTGSPIVGITFTVNSNLDQPDDLTIPGTCHTTANTCTLRAAIMQANRTSGLGATIIVPAGIYTLTIPASGADDEASGDLNLTTPASGNPIITILGAGSGNTTIDANYLDRVFHVYIGRTATISGVTIRNGYIAGIKTQGGGIYNEGLLTVSNAALQGNHVQDFGGGISSSGSLTIVNSTLSQNSSIWGGGIAGSGVLDISGTTISGNNAQDGGGIFNQGSLTLKNSTLSGNQITGDGGAIFNFNGLLTAANVYNTSIVFNGADSDQNGGLAGGVYNQAGATFNLRNSLVAGNFVANSPIYEDCNGVLNSYGRNLFWDLTGCTVNTASGSWTTLNSLSSIGILQNNGGSTETVALLPGSNAIDGGDPVQGCVDESSVLLTTDQRGIPRPQGVYCDIGAYEYAQATFSDVPVSYWAWQYVEKLYVNGITGGCGASPLIYCPDATVTRAQMAIFLLRGMHGSAYNPPAVGGSTGFNDVAPTDFAAAWIKQLALEGITGGCGPSLYCPNATVTRAQMAIFLLRGEHGSGYTPPDVGASTGFNDVAPTDFAAAWIKQLALEGITGGCGPSLYCPTGSVTRAEMAIFLVRAFSLP